jgi:hypothetical protein
MAAGWREKKKTVREGEGRKREEKRHGNRNRPASPPPQPIMPIPPIHVLTYFSSISLTPVALLPHVAALLPHAAALLPAPVPPPRFPTSSSSCAAHPFDLPPAPLPYPSSSLQSLRRHPLLQALLQGDSGRPEFLSAWMPRRRLGDALKTMATISSRYERFVIGLC